jgi:predicted nucleic acid-binding protein
MIVVADTSPLNYFVRLGLVDILPKIYGRVLVPHAVLVEMQHPEAPLDVRLFASNPPSWIEERQAGQIDLSLPIELGPGEREAISLAVELNADILLIDERAGRSAAKERHLAVAGTLVVLLQASLLELLPGSDFPELIKRLRQLGFRVSNSVQEELLARYERARRGDR